jgi:Outer membrane protein beta-barrel domain
MKKSLLAALTLVACATGAVAADNNAVSARFLLGAGLTVGGDKLISVPFSDGSTDSVKAGDLVQLYLGGEVSFGGPLAVQATLGYHVADTKAATNGSVKFQRKPVDLLVLYTINEKFRLGAGAQFVSGATLKSSGAGTSILGAQRKYKNTTGVIVEGEFLIGPKLGAKLRYVSEKYTPTTSNTSIDGSHAGVLMSYYF